MPLRKNYVRDFFIAAILPVSVIFVKISHIARTSRWMPTYCFNLAAVLAVSVTLVIWRNQASENCGLTNIAKYAEWHIFKYQQRYSDIGGGGGGGGGASKGIYGKYIICMHIHIYKP